MFKYIIVTINALILLATISFAADDNHVQKKSRKIVEQKNAASALCESTSGLGQQLCAQKKFDVADRKLNVTYKSLITKLPEVEGVEGGETETHPRKRLINAQRAWMKFRDANCEFVGEINGGAPIWRQAYESYCRAEITETRAKELQNILKEYN
jgi:uncharacterized protein YecT (DUF1311 family)